MFYDTCQGVGFWGSKSVLEVMLPEAGKITERCQNLQCITAGYVCHHSLFVFALKITRLICQMWSIIQVSVGELLLKEDSHNRLKT